VTYRTALHTVSLPLQKLSLKLLATRDQVTQSKMHYPAAQIQIDGCEMFENRDDIIKVFNESSVEDIHKNISYYEEKIRILTTMLKFIEPYYGPQNLARELELNPDFDNNVFDISFYAMYEDREYIYKREIEDFLAILSAKMVEYSKYSMELTVNAGVALALLRVL
jgi:hypothetical protein